MTANGKASSSSIVNGVPTYSTYAVGVSSGSASLASAFALSNTPGPPASITVTGSGQSAVAGEPFATKLTATVKDAGGNLLNGVPVTLTGPTSGPGAFFGANITTTIVTTNSSGLATVPVTMANLVTGSYQVQASTPGVTAVPYSLTNTACTTNCSPITVTATSVGQNLQTLVTMTLPAFAVPTGSGTLNVTLTSSDPTKLLLSARANAAGTGSVTVQFSVGPASASVYVQGLVSSGTVYVVASAPGVVFGAGQVTLTPSGFVLVQNSTLGGSLVTTQNFPVSFSLDSYQLDSGMNPIQSMSVSGALATPPNVTIQDPNLSVGTLSQNPVTFEDLSGNPTDNVSITFNTDPVNIGTTTLTVTTPTGFSTPASGATLVITVNSSTMSVNQADPTIGQGLETQADILLTGLAPNSMNAIVTSNSPALVVSNSPTLAGGICSAAPCVVGKNSIVVPISSGQGHSAFFYLQNSPINGASSGTAQYTVTLTGYLPLTQTVTLAPSGVVISGPNGLGTDFNTTTLSLPSSLTVQTYVLDQNNNPVSAQNVAGGNSVTSNISENSNGNIGSITVTPVTIAANTNIGQPATAFQPNPTSTCTGPCIDNISVDVPAGFTPPNSGGSLNAIVNEPSLKSIDSLTSIGQNLQVMDTITFGAPAPAAGMQITVTSNSPNLLVAPCDPNVFTNTGLCVATSLGSNSLVINVPGGATNASYYLQATANSGTASYTYTSPGWTSKPGSVTMLHSGVGLVGPLGPNGQGAVEHVSAGPDSSWAVYTMELDGSNNYLNEQQLIAGMTVTANLSTDGPDGTVTSSVTIVGGTYTAPSATTNGGGTNSAQVTFTPVTPGNVDVILSQPSNFGIAHNPLMQTIPVIIKP